MSHQTPPPGGIPGDHQPTEPAVEPTSSKLSRKNGLIALGVVAALMVGFLVGTLGGSDDAPASAAPPVAASTGADPDVAAPDGAAPAGDSPVSTSAAPTTSVAPLAQKAVVPSPPVRIQVPAIGVDDDFIDLGLNDDGTLEVPQDFQQVGWFADGAKPGDTNYPPTIIAGHVDSFEGPAVFYDLGKLEIGDQIRITQADGTVAVYVMYAASRFPKAEFPADTVYADRPESEIVLITCTGGFDESARSYEDNLVVSARLDPSLSGLES